MKTVACRIDLGYTRIAGYTLYDTESLEFQETTPKDVEKLIHGGKVNGLAFDGEGKVIPDMYGWNLGNIKIKSGVGNYRNFNTDDPRGDTVYNVVRAFDVEGIGRIYEVINNRCARKFYTGKQLVVLSQMAWVGGIMVDDDDNIVLLDGVKVEDKSNMPVFELGNDVLTKEQLGEVLGQDGTGEAQEAQEDKETPGDEVATGFQFDSLDDVLKDLETGEQAEEAPAEEVYEGQETKEAQGDVQGPEDMQEPVQEPEGAQVEAQGVQETEEAQVEAQGPEDMQETETKGQEAQEAQENEEAQEGHEDNANQEMNGSKGNRNKSRRKK